MTTLYLSNDYGYSTAECANCGEVWDIDELNPLADAEQRLSIGDEIPAGECPHEDCGACCYADSPRNNRRALLRTFAERVLGLLESHEEWNSDCVGEIGAAATDLRLGTTDERGMFRVVDENGEPE